MRGAVAFAALITWFATVLAGLYMLAVWLIENDVTSRSAATTSRLPVPVVFAHLGLAVTGLVIWVSYLLLDRRVLAWAAVFVLALIALLGLAMFARWIPVYRGPTVSAALARPAGTGYGLSAEVPAWLPVGIPAEGNFPLVVVVGHGILAVSTFVLALLSALGVGVS
jgi:hypothetical protein